MEKYTQKRDCGTKQVRREGVQEKRWVRYEWDSVGENTRKHARHFSDCANESAREMRKNKYKHTTVQTLGVRPHMRNKATRWRMVLSLRSGSRFDDLMIAADFGSRTKETRSNARYNTRKNT